MGFEETLESFKSIMSSPKGIVILVLVAGAIAALILLL